MTGRSVQADLSVETAMMAGRPGAVLVGMDEVGRGALAGPVSVGACAITIPCGPVPERLTDSKLLSPQRREALVPMIRSWALAGAVAHASAAEIDAIGIVAALRLAGRRALRIVVETTGPVSAVLLDGSHDWLRSPEPDLWAAAADDWEPGLDDAVLGVAGSLQVTTRVKADMTCASVSGASVLAKCERDAIMRQLATRDGCESYGWASNKGYGASGHIAALQAVGPSDQHRRSWRLPLRLDSTP